MWIDIKGNLYQGDMRDGDRAATAAEISAWQYGIQRDRLKQAAKLALAASEITMSRCTENAVAFPVDWTVYRKALRAIAGGTDTTSTVLPNRPPYPAGT